MRVILAMPLHPGNIPSTGTEQERIEPLSTNFPPLSWFPTKKWNNNNNNKKQNSIIQTCLLQEIHNVTKSTQAEAMDGKRYFLQMGTNPIVFELKTIRRDKVIAQWCRGQLEGNMSHLQIYTHPTSTNLTYKTDSDRLKKILTVIEKKQ